MDFHVLFRSYFERIALRQSCLYNNYYFKIIRCLFAFISDSFSSFQPMTMQANIVCVYSWFCLILSCCAKPYAFLFNRRRLFCLSSSFSLPFSVGCCELLCFRCFCFEFQFFGVAFSLYAFYSVCYSIVQKPYRRLFEAFEFQLNSVFRRVNTYSQHKLCYKCYRKVALVRSLDRIIWNHR